MNIIDPQLIPKKDWDTGNPQKPPEVRKVMNRLLETRQLGTFCFITERVPGRRLSFEQIVQPSPTPMLRKKIGYIQIFLPPKEKGKVGWPGLGACATLFYQMNTTCGKDILLPVATIDTIYTRVGWKGEVGDRYSKWTDVSETLHSCGLNSTQITTFTI